MGGVCGLWWARGRGAFMLTVFARVRAWAQGGVVGPLWFALLVSWGWGVLKVLLELQRVV